MTMTEKLNINNGLQVWQIEQQAVMEGIVHLAASATFQDGTFNKRCSGLTVSCFESPKDTIKVIH
jgi:hypothetical protein